VTADAPDAGLATFVSPLTGIVRSADEIMHAPDEQRLVSVGCVVGGLRGDEDGGAYSGGCRPSRAAAWAAAVGEAVERYSAAHRPDGLVLSSARDLGRLAVPPERFALFADWQHAQPGFPFRRFDDDARVRWVEGFELPGGSPALLPAQLIYLGLPEPAETPIAYATSNGLACGGTREEAIAAGLLEVLERDAFMIAWYARLSLPRLDWSGDRELVRRDERYFAPTRLRYSAVDLSAVWDVPTVLGVVHGGREELSALGVGAGAATSVGEAWEKALAEAFCVHRWVRDIALEQPHRLDSTPEVFSSFDDHTLYYAPHARARSAAFLDAADATRRVGDVPELPRSPSTLIEALTARLHSRGCSAYAVDVSSPEVRTAGLAVMRVVCPELCPLDVFETARFLGGERLYRVPYELGLSDRVLAAADLNPLPHPFP
jgi:ribosomal protein S12 methylthiotransferase accessory factor